MPRIVSPHIDVYVFRRSDGAVEFLQLLRNPNSRVGGSWQSVHGGIEPGESAWRAAARELREETGLTPLRFWQLECVNTFYMAREDVVLLCPCFVAEVAADAGVTLCEEHTAFRWLPPEETEREFLWPGQRRAVREVMEMIVAGSPAERFLRISLDGG